MKSLTEQLNNTKLQKLLQNFTVNYLYYKHFERPSEIYKHSMISFKLMDKRTPFCHGSKFWVGGW